MFKIPTILKQSSAGEAVVGDTSLKRFTFQPPIPLPLDGSSAMEVFHKARLTLDEKGQPLKERFSFQPAIPIPLENTSVMETSHKDSITLDEKAQPPEERFSFRTPIPMPMDDSSVLETSHKARITLDEKEQPLKERFSFQQPIPLPFDGSSAMEAFHKARIILDEKPLKERFSFQPPIPIPLDDSSVMETSHKARITLDEKEQPPKERFNFQPPIPIPLENTSVMETSHKDRITLDEKAQPPEERFSFQPPIPIPLENTSVMETFHKDRITMDEKAQLPEERFSFQPPIPIPLDDSSVLETSYKARIILEGKDQLLEELFSFLSLSLDSSSAMEAPHRDRIILDAKAQPLKERFSFQSPISIPVPLDVGSAKKASHNDGIPQDDKGQTLQKRIIYQSPFPMPLAGSSAMDGKDQFMEELFSFQLLSLDSKSAVETLAKNEKEQPLEERFSSQSPIRIPSTSSSALETPQKDRFTVDEKVQAVEERLSSQSPISIPSTSSSALETPQKDRITLDEKGQPLDKPFNFQPPIPLPSNSRLAVDALLANNHLFEAFHKARITLDGEGQPLVEHFFRHCIENNRFKVFADLCLNEDEEQMVYRLLQECGSRQAETVQLILLLQNNKYIEAVKFMEYVSAKRKMPDDALNRLTSAYRSTMSPVTRGIADTYLSLHGKLDMGLENVPSLENRRPLSSQLARLKPTDMKSCVFSTLLAENQVQGPMRLHNNIPFLRTQKYGSSEMPQRLRSVRPIPYRTVGKRHNELKESDEEPSSKRFRFQPPISLHLNDSSAMQSGGKDAAEKAPAWEKITVIEVSPPPKASSAGPQPSGVPHQDSPIDRSLRLRSDDSKGESFVTTLQRRRRKHKPLLEVIKEDGSLDILRRGPRLRSVQSTPSLKTVPWVPSESKQSRLGRTARRQSYQLDDTSSKKNREFHPRRHPI